MKILKIAYIIGGIDKNTLIVGKIKTIEDAKRICKKSTAKSLPNPGYEVLVDVGTVKLDYKPNSIMYPDKPFIYERSENGVDRKYKTYLQNNAGTFRVWTWIG